MGCHSFGVEMGDFEEVHRDTTSITSSSPLRVLQQSQLEGLTDATSAKKRDVPIVVTDHTRRHQ